MSVCACVCQPVHGCVVSLIVNTYTLIVFLLSNSKWGRAGCNPGPLIILHERESLNMFALKHRGGFKFLYIPSRQLKLNMTTKNAGFGECLTCSFMCFIEYSHLPCCVKQILTGAVCLIWNNWCQTDCATPRRVSVLKGLENKWSQD